ncbi:glucose-1-phosphate cytidylyltransferase [Arachnia propionica]|uniref:Glucose-1-phosphate cytidylyltransferase n=1 Tax=Arachnia propionica TaxID=1750 RepID=A0A3P1T819_9ACTN|nr:sugar phosphate nucleotidyltransferase [Arachnia propionica]RRD05408.1 glucose-1-phosphate cytidylyltransferase [Arachnia propionica]
MKVVLFCGGHGMRMRGWDGEGLPKPLQLVGDLPLVVHVMSHYASYGHTDFVLCLGYAADQVQRAVDEVVTRRPEFATWRVRHVHTGEDTSIGQRLWQVRDHVADQEMFFVNYSDVLSDVSLDAMVAQMTAAPEARAMMLAVRPRASYHVIHLTAEGRIAFLSEMGDVSMWVNGGYLILRPSFLDELSDGADLLEAFGVVTEAGHALAHQHEGFWMPADTFKERAHLDEIWTAGQARWARRMEIV